MVKRTKRYTKRRGRKGTRGTRRKGISRKRSRSRSKGRRTHRTRRRVGVFSGTKNPSATNAPKASAKSKSDRQPKKCKLCGKEGETWKECTNEKCYMHQFTKNNKWLPPEEITTKRGEKIMIKKLTDSAIAQVRRDHPEVFEQKKKRRKTT